MFSYTPKIPDLGPNGSPRFPVTSLSMVIVVIIRNGRGKVLCI